MEKCTQQMQAQCHKGNSDAFYLIFLKIDEKVLGASSGRCLVRGNAQRRRGRESGAQHLRGHPVEQVGLGKW